MQEQLIDRLSRGWQLKETYSGWWVSGKTETYRVQMSELVSRSLMAEMEASGVIEIYPAGEYAMARLT